MSRKPSLEGPYEIYGEEEDELHVLAVGSPPIHRRSGQQTVTRGECFEKKLNMLELLTVGKI